ncbi:MAG: Flp pilus assembly protein CpaB [Candidatus Eremiobacteraeota bacterium]|nr:Flp pilus assembly protein CpaB [Candidatus Eremiobacteraeota bacterium]MBC5801770.1 Flp pilus assembly protein CpaB [Candidatus Eremiobacteraeota bacterium]MBC5821682.1 Flp pilus assembly protein CpaB [Candidatus Eremiobacteraeota bacterium]
MNSRRITMIIAVVVAVAAGLLTVRYLTAVDRSTQPAVVETKPVLIASVDIPARAKIAPEMLTKVTRPVTQVEPGALSDPHAAEGDLALVSIREGSTITDSEVGQPAAIGITGKLKPGMRAVSIPMDLVKSVSGLVQPGDRVDVMASVNKSSKNLPTRTIIRGALVLAVNSTLEPGAQPSPAPGQPTTSGSAPDVVTLAVTPDQADLLTFADLNTTLRLALRSPTEPIRSYGAESLVLPTDAPAAPPPAPPPANVAPPPNPVPPPAVRVPAPAVKPTGIIVIEGDQVVGGVR